MSEEQKIAELKRMESTNKPYTGKHTPYTKPQTWRSVTRDLLSFALLVLVLVGLYNMMPTNDPEPTYTPAQVVIASPTFLAMATAVPLVATPTLAPTATETTTPTNTATGTASATPSATNTSTPTAKPTRPAFAVVKVVTAVPTPLPPLNLEPFRFPVSVVALVALICGLTICALIYVSRTYSEPIAAAANMSRPIPSSEVLSPPTWQPVININVGNSQPVTRAPLIEDEDAITVWPDVSADFAPRGELASPPTLDLLPPINNQNAPVSHVTHAQNDTFKRVQEAAPAPLFPLEHVLTPEDWQEVHTFLQWCEAVELGKGKGGPREWCYRILWKQQKSGASESYKKFSQMMDELKGA